MKHKLSTIHFGKKESTESLLSRIFGQSHKEWLNDFCKGRESKWNRRAAKNAKKWF